MVPNVTLSAFKEWSRDVAPAARAVLMARVAAEMTRERVDAYIRPIFDSYGFVYGNMFRSDDSTAPKVGSPIADPKHLYLCTDEARLADYYAECDTAHRAHGFTGPAGHCPALTAENLVVQVENALIELAKPLFGVESYQLYGDDRVKYLELLIGACIKAESERRR